MRAIDIINFINEDKFSKYTVKQIYDELGDEDFLAYLETACTKIIRGLKTLTFFDEAKPVTRLSEDDLHVYYKQKTHKEHLELIESLMVYLTHKKDALVIRYCFEDRQGFVTVTFPDWIVMASDTNIIPLLRDKINFLYNSSLARQKREERLHVV